MAPFDLSAAVSLAAPLLGAGVVAGLLAGLLGVGGGIVMVPVLFHIFGAMGLDESLRMHLAVGTSLACIVPTSVSSIRSHYRRGGIDAVLFKGWSPWVGLGTVVGSLAAGAVRGPVLTAVFATLALSIAVHTLVTPDGTRLADQPPRGVLRAAIGAAIGTISAMAGVGGGSMTVPTLALCNTPIRIAIGTSAAIGFVIAFPGTLGFIASGWGETGLPALSLGYVNVLGLALITPTSLLMAPIGARVAHTVHPQRLRRCFAVFLFVTSARMFYGLLS